MCSHELAWSKGMSTYMHRLLMHMYVDNSQKVGWNEYSNICTYKRTYVGFDAIVCTSAACLFNQKLGSGHSPHSLDLAHWAFTHPLSLSWCIEPSSCKPVSCSPESHPVQLSLHFSSNLVHTYIERRKSKKVLILLRQTTEPLHGPNRMGAV